MRLRPRAALVTAVLLVPGSVIAASPADAAVPGYSITTQPIGGGSSVNIRSAPSTSSPIIRTAANGSAISIACQLVGGRLGFSKFSENRTWDRLADGRYVHDVVTTTPGGPRAALSDGGYVSWSGTIPQCSPAPVAATSVTAKALQWADQQARGNRWQADPADSARFSDWGAITGEWSGDCPKFVITAYLHAGKTLLGGDAKAMWAKYGSPTNGSVRAPAGALVFWPDQSKWGHVALADGNGQVYTTLGTDGARLPIWHGDLSQRYGQPTGWAMP